MARAKAERAKALDEALARMFRTLEARPVPGSVAAMVAQLDAPPAPFRKAG